MSRKDTFLLRMLIFVPICLTLNWLQAEPIFIFTTAGLAIIPLAAWIANFTEAIANEIGPFLGGLLNVTFGNVTEIVVSLVALQRGLIDVVKASLAGSIIANLLIGLGISFLLAGLRFRKYREETNLSRTTVARINSSSLNLAVVFLLTPAALNLTSNTFGLTLTNKFSYVAAFLLLTFYALMLLFSMKTHRYMYELEEDAEPESYGSEARGENYNLWFHMGLLLATSIVLVLVSEALVGSLETSIASLGLTERFIGVIILPIFGAAVEYITCGICALKNKVDLSISVALGSSLQIALFVAPLLVLAGWLMGQPMNLGFDIFTVMALGITVVMTNSVSTDGRSNWLEGVLLLMTYIMLGTAFYLHP
ncbi:cation transporter [Neosynechococcus sphagnicola sy1]|uniref:Ca(2+)/H(+) antiporter n=2 Tax=Neosynechococcus TaxID=1501143 RepID=A0A098TP18_9CYAN|nr:cation transporter [Neosynechococcus sphagnicola sy1]